MTDIKNIAEKTRQLLLDAGAEKAQYTVSETEKHEFNVDGGEFSLFRTLFDRSLSLTAYKDQKKGSAFTNQFDDEAVEGAVTDCIKSAESGVAAAVEGQLPAGKGIDSQEGWDFPGRRLRAGY